MAAPSYVAGLALIGWGSLGVASPACIGYGMAWQGKANTLFNHTHRVWLADMSHPKKWRGSPDVAAMPISGE